MITEKDFLVFDQKTGQMRIGNHILTKGELESFSKAAKDLKQNDAYILVMREMWNIGERKIFFEGEEMRSRQQGIGTLWVLDLIIKKVENMSRLK